MNTLLLKHIHQMVSLRPPEYLSEVLSLGEVKDGVLFIKDVVGYNALKEKYSKQEQFLVQTKTSNGTQALAINIKAPVIRPKTSPDIWGPPLWKELHEVAKENGLTSEFLENFTRRIPCCKCKGHWRRILEKNPPKDGEHYQWSVDRHNEVNLRLGRDLWKIN